ncbi:MAG TPA: lamin tail domain-containing protein [Verrucomicrobiales bacterium]|nr:lamin tail domain-containing protein [Verrucomicrobiales bacterium]
MPGIRPALLRQAWLVGAFAALLPAGLTQATLRITEFVAVNAGPLTDEDGALSDWIEIHNSGSDPVELGGLHLTDDRDLPTRWTLPLGAVLSSGEYRIVFASGKNRIQPEHSLHTNFSLASEGEYLALIASDGVTVLDEYAPAYPVQSASASYGRGANGEPAYLIEPTPGWANSPGENRSIPAPVSSVPSGIYESPLQVHLATEAGATLRYTFDGTAPGLTGSQFYEGPLTVAHTTVLRVRAFFSDGSASRPALFTYIFPESVASDENMDPRVFLRAEAVPIEEALRSVPVLSLAGDPLRLFGDNGIYTNPRDRGNDAEVEVGFDLFNLPRSAAVSFSGGLRVHGGDARHNHEKKPLRIEFSEAYSGNWFEHPLFPEATARRFRSLVLRGQGHDAWTEPRGNDPDSRAYHATYLRDAFVRRAALRMGVLAPADRYIHLFLNGAYWGLYNLQEQPTASFLSENLGGDPEEWDLVRSSDTVLPGGVFPAEAVAGNLEAWDTLQLLSQGGVAAAGRYRDIQEYLNLDLFIDSMLLRMWSSDHDWLGPVYWGRFITHTPNNNWFAARRTRGLHQAPFHFIPWDAEITLGTNLFTPGPKQTLDFDLTRIDVTDTPAFPFSALRSYAPFQLHFADRLHKQLSGSGALASGRAQELWDSLASVIRSALWAESARWGDVHRGRVLTPSQHWEPEVAWVRDRYLTQRNGIFTNHCEAQGLYPRVDPPEIDVPGGVYSVPQVVRITNASQFYPVYYTRDGSEPLDAATWTTSPAAQLYDGPFLLSESARLVARRYADGLRQWSARSDAEYWIGEAPASAASLVLTEFLPSPPAATQTESSQGYETEDFEFLEFRNTNSLPILLDGLLFTHGITFAFPPGSTLASGDRLVLARNPNAIRFRHPDLSASKVYGPYSGRLRNEGERLRLVDSNAQAIFDLTFAPGAPWPDFTSENRSLVARGAAEGSEVPWRLSVSPGGLPGQSDSTDYVVWLPWHFTEQEITGRVRVHPTADPDEDGRSNLEEYAFGTDPNRPDFSVDGIVRETGTAWFGAHPVSFPMLSIRIPATADDLGIRIEESGNLSSWEPAQVTPEPPFITSDDRLELHYRSSLPLRAQSEAPLFYRVRLSVRP